MAARSSPGRSGRLILPGGFRLFKMPKRMLITLAAYLASILSIFSLTGVPRLVAFLISFGPVRYLGSPSVPRSKGCQKDRLLQSRRRSRQFKRISHYIASVISPVDDHVRHRCIRHDRLLAFRDNHFYSLSGLVRLSHEDGPPSYLRRSVRCPELQGHSRRWRKGHPSNPDFTHRERWKGFDKDEAMNRPISPGLMLAIKDIPLLFSQSFDLADFIRIAFLFPSISSSITMHSSGIRDSVSLVLFFSFQVRQCFLDSTAYSDLSHLDLSSSIGLSSSPSVNTEIGSMDLYAIFMCPSQEG